MSSIGGSGPPKAPKTIDSRAVFAGNKTLDGRQVFLPIGTVDGTMTPRPYPHVTLESSGHGHMSDMTVHAKQEHGSQVVRMTQTYTAIGSGNVPKPNKARYFSDIGVPLRYSGGAFKTMDKEEPVSPRTLTNKTNRFDTTF
ncbi:hypothetical protein [Xanthomonas sp. NCPPB 2632]|jgi:hypothetical protein|uniref:hypothetical protein n=1 Tax=Xanthomonas sp. NCPPB 2632 TaxID=3240912 RepID=UPI003511A8CD